MKLLARFRKAAALPFVLLLVALNVIVVVALLVYATTELQASRNSGQAEVARALAQSGIDLAASLIAANSTNNGFVTYQRVTNVGGAYRLETKIANVVATNNAWQKAAANPAVLHSGFAAGTNGVDLNFAVGTNNDAGFIAPRITNSGWANLSTNMFRMNWVYIYKGDPADPKNLVGRVAYWVDDESSKLSLNYSGNPSAYSSNWIGSTLWENFTIRRSNGAESRNLDPTIWPIFLDLGGISGINSNQSISILRFRGDPLYGANTTNFPSVLAVRLADNSVLSSLSQQAGFGFTATVYSKEAERSYATGKKRYDLVNVRDGIVSPPPPSEATVISDIKSAITNTYEKFNDKYDLDGFASALYASVQSPGITPARIYGTNQLYTRALPLVNEVEIKASIENNNSTNTVNVVYAVEMIMLSVIKSGNGHWTTWYGPIVDSSKYRVDLELPGETSFGGIPATNIVSLNGPTNASKWFSPYTNRSGPTYSATNSLTNALTTLSVTNSSNVPTPNWVYPTNNITVRVYYNNTNYNSFSFAPASPSSPYPTNFAPSINQTNVVYHLVAQPQSSQGYRGDARFSRFVSSNIKDPSTLQFNKQASLGFLNTNIVSTNDVCGSIDVSWQIDGYSSVTNATNCPDLTPAEVFFHNDDRGIPQSTGDKYDGFSYTGLAGVGWLGEVPITTKPGQVPVLAWSTPRFWGEGRPQVNGHDYPPDWHIMDGFHLAAFKEQPEFPGSTNLAFYSYGRINVNSAKSFFQRAVGSASQSDTIMDSMTVGARTKDFRLPNFPPIFTYTSFKLIPHDTSRTNFLSRVQDMASNRNSTNNPYVTPFHFLADLAATNLSGLASGGTNWWQAPVPGNGNTATNTSDRRAESIVRSLAQKFTTHGNQFSIFSLGQALQVVNGKTNVVGESYLQAVYERAPLYNDGSSTINGFVPGAITNGPSAAPNVPPMRQLYLRELRY
jgi:hypothetical protein